MESDGLESAKINPVTAQWFRDLQGRMGWSTHYDANTARAKGLTPALFLMDGFQSDASGQVHCGVVSLPPDKFGELHALVAKSPEIRLFAHEVKTERYRAFADLDVKVGLGSRSIGFLAAVIRAWKLGRGLETSELMVKHLKIEPFYPVRDGESRERVALTKLLVDRLCEIHPIPEDRVPQLWYWDEVLDGVLDASFQTGEEAFGGMGKHIDPDAVPEEVLRGIYALFALGMALEFREATKTLYTTRNSDAPCFKVAVFGTYSSVTKRPTVAVSVDKVSMERLYNFGCHLVGNVVVNDLVMLHLREVMVEQLCRKYHSDTPSGNVQAFFENVFDRNPFKPGGGKRLPFSYKCKECHVCKGAKKSHQGARCGMCGNTRRLSERRYSGPLLMVQGDGSVNTGKSDPPVAALAGAPDMFDDAPALDQLFGMRTVAMRAGTVSVEAVYPLTAGAAIEGRPDPAGVDALAANRLRQAVGDKKAAKIISGIVKEHGAASVHDRVIYGPLDAAAWYHEAVETSGAKVTKVVKETLAPNDPRFLALSEHLPKMLAEVFNFKGYGNLRVKGATALATKAGIDRMWVQVEGASACRCFNRCVNASDPTLSSELPPDVLAKPSSYPDVDRMPGRHAQRSNAIWFELSRGNQYGVVVQRCFSATPKRNRRNAMLLGPGAVAACAKTACKTVRLDETWVVVMRKFFFKPEEVASMKEDLLERAKHLHARRAAEFELGPTDDYGKLVRQVVAVVADHKKRKIDLESNPLTAAEAFKE